MAENRETRIVINVLGSDQPKIVHNVTGVLAEQGGNIVDIRQTILDGIFSMTMLVDIDETTTPFCHLQESYESLAQNLNVQITVQKEEIFRYMFRL